MNILELGALLLAGVFFIIIYYMDKVKKIDFSILTILGLVFGIIVGIVFKGYYRYLEAIGNIYSNLILATVIPLLFFSIISSITDLDSSIRLKKIGAKTIFFLLLNTFLAAVITLILAVVSNVGSGINYQLANNYEAVNVPDFIDTIVNLFPKNLADSWVNGEVVPIVVFCIIIAIAYNKAATNSQKEVLLFKKIIDAGNAVMKEVINFVISFTPYAVLALIARAVSKSTIVELIPLVSVMFLAYLICLIQIFGVSSLLLKIAGLKPLTFFKGIWPAGIVAFTSQSSIGTIPITVKQLTKIGVNEDIASFVTSLGANLGMPGCAGMWPILLAILAINVLNINYTLGQYLFLIVLAVVVSLGTVGVPGTATITATALFASAGLPIEIIVILAPISSIVDMIRTATNVTGASLAAILVAKSEKQIDLDKYYLNQKV